MKTQTLIAERRTGEKPGERFDGTLLWGVVLGSWALALTIPALGHGGGTSHASVLEGSALPDPDTLLLFLVA